MSENVNVGKAYLQVIPTTKGIKDALRREVGGEASPAGKEGGLKIAGAIKGAIAAAGIGTAISKSLAEGGKLQQSIGGVETLFKDNADKVIENAKVAYRTAGVSANGYMEQVTSFSASLLQGLGGDTEKAAEIANKAVIDMSDNANKMGTDIESIQNAYQGFAKGNFTMLDNLKLGYGGTKSEMARLINESGILGDTLVQVGKKGNFDEVVTFDKMIEAIGVVQDKLDITGTTSKEAATTFEGSLNAMKASVTNLLGDIALGEDITDDLHALADTASTFLLDNFVPMVGNIIGEMPDIVMEGLDSVADKLKEKFDISDFSFDAITAGLTGIATAIAVVKGGMMAYNAVQAIQQALQAAKIAMNLSETASLGALAAAELAALAPFLAIGAAIAVVVGAGVLLYKNWDKIKAGAKSMKDTVTKNFEALKSSATSKVKAMVNSVKSTASKVKENLTRPITLAKEKISGIIDSIKAKFSSITSLKWIKIPHISMSGGQAPFGIGGKGSLPHFSVAWHKDGGIFDSANIIGYGVGEAGAEAIMPLDKFWNKMDNLTRSMQSNNGSGAVVQIVLDGSVIAKSTIDYINGQVTRYNANPLLT